jgi:uncharacterized membrane protein
LYFYAVWAIARVFGISELVVRLPSVAAGILLVPGAYFVIVRWTASRAAGLLAAILIGIDPGCLTYAVEGRPYALVQLAALAHVFVFSQLLLAVKPTSDEPDNGRTNNGRAEARRLFWHRAAFVLGAALLFHLHYTAALLLPAEVLAYAAVWPWRRGRMAYGPVRLGVDLAIIAALWLPAAPHVWEVAGRRENWKDLIAQSPITDTPLWFPLVYAVVWPAILLALAVAVRWLFGSRPMIGRVSLPLVLLAACWETVPALIAWIATQMDVARLFFPRYLNVSVPAAPAIAGLLAGWTEGRFARLLQLLVVGGGAVLVYGVNIAPIYRQSGRFVVHGEEDWRGAVDFINRENERSPRPVAVYSGLIESRGLAEGDESLASYCLFPVTGIYSLRGKESEMIAIPADGRVRFTHPQATRLRSSGGIWLVVRNPPGRTAPFLHQAIDAVVETGIPLERIAVGVRRRFGNVAVFRIDCPSE